MAITPTLSRNSSSPSLNTALLGVSDALPTSDSQPDTGPSSTPLLQPSTKPGAKNRVSSTPSDTPPCETLGRQTPHEAEGYLLNSEGTKLSALCLSCAKSLLSDYRKKLTKEEQEGMKLSLWSFERFERETVEAETGKSTSVPIITSEVHLSSLDESTQSLLSSLLSEHTRLSNRISSLTSEQKTVKESIEEICLSIPSKRILFPDGLSTIRTAKSSSKFNKSLAILESLARSIDPIDFLDILSLATEKKKGKEYVMINIPDEKGKGKDSAK